MLGRRLMKIGEEAMRGSTAPSLPIGPSLVLRDLFGHPDSSITEITDRTGLPQSYVSESVARLRANGVLTTSVDPDDRRRTLVRVSEEHARAVVRRGARPVDAALAEALGEDRAGANTDAVETLQALAGRLRKTHGPPGAIARQLGWTQESTRR